MNSLIMLKTIVKKSKNSLVMLETIIKRLKNSLIMLKITMTISHLLIL